MGVSVSTQVAENYTDVTSSVSQKACTGNTFNNESGIDIKVSSSKCGNFSLGNQTAKQDCTAKLNAAINTSISNLEQAKNTTTSDPLSLSPSSFIRSALSSLAPKISTQSQYSKADIQTTYQQLCGANNVGNTLKNITLDVSNVSCKDFEAFNQVATQSTTCVVGITQQFMNANNIGTTNSNTGWWSALTGSTVGVVCAGLAMIAFAVVIAVLIFKHRKQIKHGISRAARATANAAQRGMAAGMAAKSGGASGSGVAQAAAAAAVGVPPPAPAVAPGRPPA